MQHADQLDRAAELTELMTETAIAAARAQPAGPSATGYCLNCDEPVADGRRWCDADCRDMWEARK